VSQLKPGWVDAIAQQAKAPEPPPPRYPYPSVRQSFLEKARTEARSVSQGRRRGRSGSEAQMQESRLKGAFKPSAARGKNQFRDRTINDFEFPEDDI
jgi:hypothetical protein